MVSSRLRTRFAADPEFRRRVVVALLAIFSAVGWGGLLLCSDVLTVRGVTIEGGEHIDANEARAAVWQILDAREGWRPWPARHRWFFDEHALEEGLRTRWFAEEVHVQRSFGSNIVRLIVKEQHIGLIVRTGEQYLEVDANGVVRRELSNEERLQIAQRMTGRQSATEPMVVELPFIQDQVTVGYKLNVSTSAIRSWMTLGSLLATHHVPFRYLAIPDELMTSWTLYDENGISVYLDTSTSLETQIKALAEYVEARKARRKGIEAAREFIDLRIRGRLYIK